MKRIQNHTNKAQWAGLVMILPSLLGLALFYIVPFAASLYYTFTQGVAHPKFVGLDNFRELVGNAMFRQAVGNTALFLALGVSLVLALALLVSVILAKGNFRWQRWALLLPMVVPPASLALGWRSLWGAGGLVPRLLGLGETDLLQGALAFPLLLALYVLKNVGYFSIILSSAISALPPEYRESYRLDSNSEMGYIRRILLPLIAPTMLFAVVAAVMNYFLLFRDTYALYGDDPPRQVYMLQHFMNSNFYQLNYQRLSAAAFLTVLLLTALVAGMLLLQRRARGHVG
jgi:multiple sugar transport system permease protein